jgi:hypothetical protein
MRKTLNITKLAEKINLRLKVINNRESWKGRREIFSQSIHSRKSALDVRNSEILNSIQLPNMRASPSHYKQTGFLRT